MGGNVPAAELADVNNGDSVTSAVECYRTQLDFGGKKPIPSAVHSEDHTNVSHAKKLILAFQNQRITEFSGVFWFVDTPKAGEELREEAAFINKLAKPESNGHGFCIWKHVVVILKGIGGLGGAREAVSHATRDNTRAQILRGVIVYMSSAIAGVTVSGGRVIHIQQDEHLAVSGDPTAAGALLTANFDATAYIKWIEQTMKCKRCLQSGDPRAFYACHAEVEKIHQHIPYHPGNLLQMHGERDVKDLAKSVGKKMAAVVAVTAAVTTVALPLVVSVMFPPLAPALVVHLTITIAATGAAAPIAEALGKDAFPGIKSRMPLVHLTQLTEDRISKELSEKITKKLSQKIIKKLTEGTSEDSSEEMCEQVPKVLSRKDLKKLARMVEKRVTLREGRRNSGMLSLLDMLPGTALGQNDSDCNKA
ncbi:hypothetical protein A1O3_03594 [Capronia epimyces CBS 606.96]|uniref:Uncharacterized protein n=1 Tax=Capronia epimyces CBS 606.96 TaxID=1182542 RepID=W9YBJ9_9EURO|nr:uncharacterized protein A1O3_03594 [Capronia epimyces CBS 606.96]EXJ86641.1 hypothetical protein A1O3_03594 [Capronia epimyces CBS 606.96]